MTREQAIKLATEGMQATGAHWSEGAVAADVAILEALGLLKFEEPSDRFIQPKTHFAPPKTRDQLLAEQQIHEAILENGRAAARVLRGEAPMPKTHFVPAVQIQDKHGTLSSVLLLAPNLGATIREDTLIETLRMAGYEVTKRVEPAPQQFNPQALQAGNRSNTIYGTGGGMAYNPMASGNLKSQP
jgi:hypothetical protein